MEDNIYELSKVWKQLDESFNRIDESKKDLPKQLKPGVKGHGSGHPQKRGSGVHGYTKHKPAPRQKKVEIDETTGAATAIPGDSTSAGPVDATVAGGGNVAQYKKKLGEKKVCKENFDIASLGGQVPEIPEVPEIEMGADVESPAVSDIIAGLHARYPGAIIEISVTAPEGHRFSDTDIACATEVANASETPEELGGAWEKTAKEGEEDEESEEGTKPLAEAYPPSFGKKEDTGEEEGGEEESEEDGEEEAEEKPTFGGDDGGEEEAEEGEEGGEGIESCAGISQDCITLSPEEWSAFLVQADSQMGGEEEEELDEGMCDPGPGGSGRSHRELQDIKKKAAEIKKPLPPKV